MTLARRPFNDSSAWQQTTPAALPPEPAVPGASRPTPVGPRIQPPLQEVLQGLDARELEGQTVFDQLFGARPDTDPRPPRG